MINEAQRATEFIGAGPGITFLLVIGIVGITGALIYVAAEFKATNERFITFITSKEEAFEKQLAVCESRCESNTAHFFNVIQTLLAKVDNNRG